MDSTRKKGRKSGRQSQIQAVGVIVPAEWDEKGAPVVIALSTYREETFIVDETTSPGNRLRGMIHKKVRVTGSLTADRKGRTFIRVLDVTELDPSLTGEEPPKSSSAVV